MLCLLRKKTSSETFLQTDQDQNPCYGVFKLIKLMMFGLSHYLSNGDDDADEG